MQLVDVLPAVGIPRKVMQAGRVAVVLAPALGRPDGDAADAVGQGPVPDDDAVRALHAAIAEEAKDQIVKRPRPAKIADGQIEVVHLAPHGHPSGGRNVGNSSTYLK